MAKISRREPTVAAVTVTRNRQALLRQCLQAISAQTRQPDEIIVVDNASTDGTAEMVHQEFPWATYIYSADNTGCAGGFSQGLSAAYERGHDLFWCMDDDCWPMCPEALATLLQYIGECDAQILTPLMCDPTRREYRGGGFWSGGLFRREIIAAAGVPDPSLFMCYEDIEYYRRIAEHKPNMETTKDPRCAVWHPCGSRTTLKARLRGQGRRSPWRLYYQIRNPLYVDLRCGSRWLAVRRSLLTMRMLATCLLFDSQRFDRARYAFQGIGDGIVGRMGRRVEPEPDLSKVPTYDYRGDQ